MIDKTVSYVHQKSCNILDKIRYILQINISHIIN